MPKVGDAGKRDREPGWALRELERETAEWLALTPGEALYRARRLGLVGPFPSDPKAAALVLGSRLGGAMPPRPEGPKQPGGE